MLLYSVEGLRINDSWYCIDQNNVYHSYFLEYGCDEPPEFIWSRQRIGHVVSEDMYHYLPQWKNQPFPKVQSPPHKIPRRKKYMQL